ncbi:MAG: hypothetical protein ABF904_11240 [Ethanoligenens sp.]
MPCFKTLSLQIHAPGQQKQALMDAAMLSYTRALEQLLRQCKEPALALARAGGRVTRAQVQALADSKMLRALNVYDVQPFKDALKQDFSTMLLGFIARWQKTGGHVGYPCVRLEPDEAEVHIQALLERYDGGRLSSAEAHGQLAACLSHSGRVHPLYFGRYAAHRDYCLLYDPQTDRFYAKMYLLNARNCLPAPPVQRVLHVVAAGLPPAHETGVSRRFIVVPLSFGKEQQAVLRQALDRPQILRTARLVRRGDAYSLVLSVEVYCTACVVPQTTMGVARTVGGLTCTVCDKHGEVTQNMLLAPVPGRQAQMLFSFAKTITARALEARAQVILEANGGRGDGVALPKDEHARASVFSGWDYARLGKILRYKLLEAGLPPPAFVSGGGLNSTCPRCGAVTRRNRLTPLLFACVSCGYAAPFQFIGSRNLAVKLQKYAGNKVPVYVREENGVRHFFNDILGFSCTLSAGIGDAHVFYELSLMAKGQQETWCDGKKYAMLCKLRAAENIRDAVRWVPVK